MRSLLESSFIELVLNEPDLYKGMNAYCAWFNKAFKNYQFILDDEWFDEKTTIEYQLRSLDTLNILPLAVDEYQNHRDNQGVWHLDDYVQTLWLVEKPLEHLLQFIEANTPLQTTEE